MNNGENKMTLAEELRDIFKTQKFPNYQADPCDVEEVCEKHEAVNCFLCISEQGLKSLREDK